ncbi:PspC domain-containing protein [Faecalibacter sp. LW9]|uniref:PspC domain-containing protein n=1 Tax=Faecalibacter sp. LW9 TaxID=3103144 RepID=UPI002AFFCA5A|nr:PspC domain-containing protein [Faecalibacter sp. LW9]
MDKTISISLGGFSFIIDENAYAKLKTYLQDVRNSLRGTEGVEDIIEDVEIRISELFRDRIKFREVVNDDDVNFVIATMGHPNQYKVEEDENESISNPSSYSQPSFETKNNKRLFRDPDDKVMTGLSAGLAHYLGLDPWAVRATWLVLGILGLFTGFSFLLVVVCYFILLIFVPKAKTTSEKLQMYGKPANIETLKKNAEQASEVVISGGRELSNKLGGAFGVLGKFILWFIGFIILMIGIGLIIGGCAISFTTWMDIPTELFGYLIEEQWMSIATKILGGVLMIIPGILLTILGLRCFTRIKTSKALIIGSIVAWFIALITIIGFTASTAAKFKNEVELNKNSVLTIPSDTLVVNFREENSGDYIFKSFDDFDQLIDENGNLVIKLSDKITLKSSDDANYRLEVKYSSRGGNSNESKRNLEAMVYNFNVSGNQLTLDEFFKIKPEGKFRKQDIKITLYVPQGKYVQMRSVDTVILTDADGDKDYYHENNNKIFKNLGQKFVCLNCETNDHFDEENDVMYDADGIEIRSNNGTKNAKVSIDQNGIQIQTNEGNVGISTQSKNKNNPINFKDDTDSIHINYGDHQNNR